jgi:beta-phosphoglucomutase
VNGDLSQIKAIIFDMDGVLFLSVGAHEKAFKETLATVGVEDFSYASIAGMRTDAALRKIFAELGRELPEDELERLRQDKTERARLALARDGKVVADSSLLISLLRQKFRLALASSASPHNVELFMRKCDYPDAFEFCLDGTLVKDEKPSPEIYLLALKKLGLTPKECIVIEDAVSGVQAGVNAGIQVIAVCGTEEPRKLFDAGAIHVAANLRELTFLTNGRE